MTDRTFNALHVFSGIGGVAMGFTQARGEFRGVRARFRTIGAIDNDPEACEDFRTLVGVPATCMDLFTREDYIAFHGHEPPAGWSEVTPADIRAACGGQRPDVVFASPPCKGFSGLLSGDKSRSPKYEALNHLVTRWLFLVLEAFSDAPPGLLMLENVPRIKTRGRALLDVVTRMLQSCGYACAETVHDCGELGGLGQTRKRFLLVARHHQTVPSLLYEPLAWPLRTIGDVIGDLPMPGVEGGLMHVLPNLKRETWIRLALIRAGHDWRDLAERWAPGRWSLIPDGQRLRLVQSTGEAIDDPRVGAVDWHKGVMGVRTMGETSGTVTGRANVSTGAFSVADPRLATSMGPNSVTLRVKPWDKPSPVVTGRADVWDSGGFSVADPRPTWEARNGTMGVQPWGEPSTTVTGSGDIHAGSTAVADPRDAEAPVIISDDGCWHRPLTTLELAALQSFPTSIDGAPLKLSGMSGARWRMGIGNAVPPATARAIAEQMLLTLLVGEAKGFALSTGGGVWVREAGVLRWHETSRQLISRAYTLEAR